MRKIYLVFLALPMLGGGQQIVQPPQFQLEHPNSCPSILPQVFAKSVPVGGTNKTSMTYTFGNTTDLSQCVNACCSAPNCSVAFMYFSGEAKESEGCWLVSCSEDRLCLPLDKSDEKKYEKSSIVLVRPLTPPWPTVTPQALTKNDTISRSRVCEVGLDSEVCHANEFCEAKNDKSRNGICKCQKGFVPDASGKCFPAVPTPTSPPALIAVSVASKSVQLPLNSASLTVFTSPEPDKKNPYKYEWKLVSMSKTDQTAVEKNSKTQTLTLSNLVEGVYQFKVTVTSSNPAGFGQTFANVTVEPAKRINTPPKAIIVPTTQTVNLPTNKAIVDGSGSTDDSGPIKTYYWEILSGPVGYQPELEQLPTMTLSNLTSGNYTIKLTVTDEDGATSSTTSMLEVLKDTDYKPKANAGEDKIIFLPTNTVTINGNKSYDDHEIVTWEWTKEKGEDGTELSADISGARTPYITASNLDQGIYNFLLKVTDVAGQTDEDKVAVYVKPPTNLPPVANAGPDQSLSLPISFVTLDGTKSSDDGNITAYKWTMSRGPKQAKLPLFSQPGGASTNVTGLTVGEYIFKLVIIDNSGNNNSDTVNILIKQDTNAGPVSNPGPNLKVILPTNEVTLDGSGSSDDLAIEKWVWRRDSQSLAAGKIVGNMTHPQLTLTNLVPGTYSFSLQVYDGQGKNDSKSVKITVLQDPGILNVVEAVLNKNLSHFSQKQKTEVLERIRVLTKGKGELSVGDVKLFGSTRTGQATLRFKVFSTIESKRKSLSGVEVVKQLKRELEADSELLGVPVVSIDTLICQNKCGGHGECDQSTKECICQPAWMENIFRRRVMGGESNCDWSVVYVCVIAGVVSLFCFVCCCLASCKKGSTKSRSIRKYARLNTNEDSMEMHDEMGSKLIHSDSDSEEEILFESSKKGRRLNGSIPRTGNGFLKNGKSGGKLLNT
eukprot:TRINITY_DN16425_c0_g1_i1.p1 TRINITY_DN16425_c0_g1~~TRINITY_DN16425_c0_g1_i1.p1  ORF type:complete len:942 (-),score=151.95 TRINITY_DN16425_c0_g1_i1:315-3140(-)